MTRITFITHDGTETTVNAKVGDSVMQTARANNIDGIVAECGGSMACSTCHCYVADEWTDSFDAPSGSEQDMLDFAACEVRPGSRLTCQLQVTPQVDGLVVHLPESQT